ncbi:MULTISPECIES: RNA pseudouridine synthase [unclassified Clostridium]|uniref:RluA family pseudouridine synthase n=1 Tax=unclassified Clostridium TaxID=2614128 RepID=UPI00110592D5|nr:MULTISPECIES: RNA pseudouridine synthase [unclassified Clostridium]
MSRVVYEDNHLLVVDKSPNVPVQADASGDSDLLSEMKAYVKARYQKPGAVYLGLVHRLDRPVGGLIVFARTSKAAARLSDQVRRHALGRVYWAVVRGQMAPEGTLEDYLLKNTAKNQVSVVESDTPGAKYARLRYRVLAERDGFSLVAIRLETGRSHQIRVQFAYAGHPLWGDQRYGRPYSKPGEQIALWARELHLEHPTKKENMVFASAVPKYLPWAWFSQEIDAISAGGAGLDGENDKTI